MGTAGMVADRNRVTPQLRTRRVRRHGGTGGVVQLVCLELAIVVVGAAALVGSIPAIAGSAIAAAALLLVVLGRVDGRWVYEELAARWRIRRRRHRQARAVAALGSAEPAEVVLGALAPSSSVIAFADRSRTIGVGRDDDGWYAGLVVGAWSDVTGPGPARVDLDLMRRMLDESSVPLSVLQLVTYAVPAAGGLADDNSIAKASLAVRSYVELLGPQICPVEQIVWLTVRLNPEDAADAAHSRGGGVDGVYRALAAALSRIEKTLTSASVAYRVLDAGALRDAVAHSCGVGPPATPGAPSERTVRERWASWTAAGLAHASFTVARWPGSADHTLLARLTQIQAGAVNISLSVRRHGDETAFCGVVRVVAAPDRLRAAVRSLNRTAGPLGVRLRRLDGEQAPAVYASAPTGGGAW